MRRTVTAFDSLDRRDGAQQSDERGGGRSPLCRAVNSAVQFHDSTHLLQILESALNAAQKLGGSGGRFYVGLCDRSGGLLGGVLVGSFAQVEVLARWLSPADYVCTFGGSPEEMKGCDFLLSPRRPCAPDLLDA